MVRTSILWGTEALPVVVEAQLNRSRSAKIIGMAEQSTKESLLRCQAAFQSSGFRWPRGLVINLSPADIPKGDSALDLPIALAVLVASGQIRQPKVIAGKLFFGELSLDGSIRAIRGTIQRAAEPGTMIVPVDCAFEAIQVKEDVIPVTSLRDVYDFLVFGRVNVDRVPALTSKREISGDWRDVRGNRLAKSALEIAAAGGHDVLLVGPPGAGKTMLSRRVPTILPEMSKKECIEVTSVYSAAGMLPRGSGLIKDRPFRAPHHTVSDIGLIGGGKSPRPGEVSLAHNGVLFLDEFPEFSRRALDCLRQPLEDGEVTISRAAGTARFPSRFMLIAAMNPCPCGWFGYSDYKCTCSDSMVDRYQARISGALMDRFDILIQVEPVPFSVLTDTNSDGESSEAIASRILNARGGQAIRGELNRDIGIDSIRKTLSADIRFLEKQDMTSRSIINVLRVARTIADLDGSEKVWQKHVRKALSYRNAA